VTVTETEFDAGERGLTVSPYSVEIRAYSR
jgi:hypothetical protein